MRAELESRRGILSDRLHATEVGDRMFIFI